MRYIPVLAAAIVLSACASQGATPETAAAAPAATAAPAAKKGPQCYSGDHGKFFDVDEKASIAGVAVTCKPTADNKAAQWVGTKH